MKRLQISYSDPEKRVAHLLSRISPDDTHIVGSVSYRDILWPGDIDMHSTVVELGSLEELGASVTATVQEVVAQIQNDGDLFYSEMKAGEDSRFELPLGEWTTDASRAEGGEENHLCLMGFDLHAIVALLELLMKYRIVSETEGRYALGLAKRVRAAGEDNPCGTQEMKAWVDLHAWVHTKKIMRWTQRDVLAGRLRWNGMEVSLEEAIMSPSVVKVDLWFWDGTRYVEASDFMSLYYEKDGKIVSQNPDQPHFVDGIKASIVSHFSVEEWGPLKGLKRMWAVAPYVGRHKDREPLGAFISGPVGQVGQIMADIESILGIESHYTLLEGSLGRERIDGTLDRMKGRLSRVSPSLIPNDALELMLDLLDSARRSVGSEGLSDLYKVLKEVVDLEAMRWATARGFYPIPSAYIPASHTRVESRKRRGGRRRGSEVQSILFDKHLWSEDGAKEWIESHGYTWSKVDETEGFYRVRQKPPYYSVYSTIDFGGNGIKAVLGWP
jgi:hypothetical protein